VEFAIKGLFDNINHERLLRAVHKHTAGKWGRLSRARWLQAPMQRANGTVVPRTKGTPQGGVVSPVLSKLFLHYAFDGWMTRTFPGMPWGRYADDGLVHWKTEQEAHAIQAALRARLAACGLELPPDKTQMVYCKDGSRKGRYPHTQFDCRGYTFRPRVVKHRKRNSVFVHFTPAVSSAAQKAMRQTTRRRNFRNRTDRSLEDRALYHNPVLRGWLEYYGRYSPSAMSPVLRHFNQTLGAWAMRTYRRLRGHKVRASRFLEGIAKRQPHLFVHWQRGMVGAFA
jgi:RNA-directed DNA polymerase